jgi:hypothetical protein
VLAFVCVHDDTICFEMIAVCVYVCMQCVPDTIMPSGCTVWSAVPIQIGVPVCMQCVRVAATAAAVMSNCIGSRKLLQSHTQKGITDDSDARLTAS